MKKSYIVAITVLTLVILVEGFFAIRMGKDNDQGNVLLSGATNALYETGNENYYDTTTINYENLTELTYSDWKQMKEDGKQFVFVIVQTTCSFCHQYEPILDEIAKEQGIPIYLLDILKMQDTEFDEFIASLPYFSENERWGTPLTMIMKDGKITNTLSGLASKDETLSFYQQNGIISE